MKMRNVAIALLLAVLAAPALAQSGTPTPAPISVASSPVSLSVTNTTGQVALTGALIPFGSALLINDGANEVFYNPGNSSVTATTSSYPLPAGYCIGVWLNGATNVAAITASSTSTLRVIQYNGAAPISCGSSGSGGGGGGVVTQPTASLLNMTEANSGGILTAAQAIQAGVTRPLGTVAAGTAAANSILGGLVYNSSPLTLTTTQQSSLQGDANGYLKVNVAAGGAGGGVAYGPTAAGSAAANPPVIIGGTIDGTATGNVDNWKVLAGIGYINCSNCSGSGVSAVDEAAFTWGTTPYAATGGFYQTTATSNALTNGQAGAWQFTAQRAGFVNLRDSSGNELGLTGAPVFVQSKSGAFPTGTFASGSIASGAVASGAVASGAYASGSLASGAMVDLVAAETPVAPNTATATKGLLAGGTYTSTQPTLTTTQQAALAFTARNAVIVAPGADSFAVQATLNAETTKVIGTVNQGTSPWVISGAVTNAGTFATQSAITAASGSIASGAVSAGAYVSGSVLSGAFASGSLAAGSMVDLLTMRGAVGAGTAPADALIGGAIYNSTPITVTNTQSAALQSDANGFLKVNVAASVLPTGAATAANQTADPCSSANNKTNVAFTTNGTSSVQLVAFSGSTTIYVCALHYIAAGATTVAFTTGTGTACVTGNAAVIGSTTANIANSMSYAANGGETYGNGSGTIAKGAASSEFCMVNGTNVYVSGNLVYVQQ